jgi:hypothetical protein
MTSFARLFPALLTLSVVGACSSTASSAPVAPEDPSQVRLGYSYCGGADDQCNGMHSTTIDFDAKTIATHRCVELPGGTFSHGSSYGPRRDDDFETHLVTDDQLERIRRALSQVRYEHATANESDGAMTVLTVTKNREEHAFTPSARCGPPDYDQIVAGLEGLEREIDALVAAVAATSTPPSGFGP